MTMVILLNSGKILDDEKTVESYKIEEKNFVVIMVTKVRESLFSLSKHVKTADGFKCTLRLATGGTNEYLNQCSK